MFEQVVEKFSGIFKKLRSKGKLSEQDVDTILKELRMVLLESDVHFRVVKDLVGRVRERAVGREVLESVTPGEMVIKTFWEEIRRILGGEARSLNTAGALPVLHLLVGLQGSGKTTTAAKLAVWLKKRGISPLLVSTDTRRPAAKEQLAILAHNSGVSFYDDSSCLTPLSMVRASISAARAKSVDAVVVDTAGRLHVEKDLLAELRELMGEMTFQERLLVLDATTGQEAVKVAETFRDWVDPTGLVLTKIDTDARGGAVLSIVAQTGWPVKLVGMGEKLEQLEVFHPERMASRILGMGDTLTLIEKIERAMDEDERKKVQKRVDKKELDLADFLEELRRIKNLGSFDELMGMLPGNVKVNVSQLDGEKSLRRVEAIIQSMTPQERNQPGVINASRKRRISSGSGTSVQEVNKLLKQFEDFRKLWKQMQRGAKTSPFRRQGFLGMGGF